MGFALNSGISGLYKIRIFEGMKQLLFILLLLSCDSPEEGYNYNVDSIELVRKREEIDNRIKDSIYRESPEYKKHEHDKAKIKAKIEGTIKNCYEWDKYSRRGGYDYFLNSNKYQSAMEKLGLKPGKYTNWYEGSYKGYWVNVNVTSRPSSNGWQQEIEVILN